jgi:SAM-dependent methyltransferase
MAAGDARSITAERDRTLALVQGEKTMVALSPEEVRHLDLRLVDAWGIQFPSDANSVEELLAGALDRTAVDRFIKARGEASDALTRGDGHSTLSIEANLFDAMVHADIFGPITSLRRHLILDGICTALGLVQRLGLDGDVLDVGCHAGFVGSLLAEALGRPATGIDPSSAAIAFGRSYRGRSPMLNLVEAAIPWDTSARFDLAIAIDGMPQEAAKMGPYLRGLSELLNPAGIAVVVSSYWKNADVEVTRRQLRQARLGFGYADVVGGYGNVPPRFEASGFLVFLKGGTRQLPRQFRTLMESEWRRFQVYANAPETARDEKRSPLNGPAAGPAPWRPATNLRKNQRR